MAIGTLGGTVAYRNQRYTRHQRWLLFLHHASKCSDRQCPSPALCPVGRELWAHIRNCCDNECTYPRCLSSRSLVSHHQHCNDVGCPLCETVRHILMEQRADSSKSRRPSTFGEYEPPPKRTKRQTGKVEQDVELKLKVVHTKHAPRNGLPYRETQKYDAASQQWEGDRQQGSSSTETTVGTAAEGDRQQYVKQQRWLLFLSHSSQCSGVGDQCPNTTLCSVGQQLWAHIGSCCDNECSYPRCRSSRSLVSHHQLCRDRQCSLCEPVRQILVEQRAQESAQMSTTRGPSTSGAAARERPLIRTEPDPCFFSTCQMMVDRPAQKLMQVEPEDVHAIFDAVTPTHQSAAVKDSLFSVKVPGVSLVELFTQDQTAEHIRSLREESSKETAADEDKFATCDLCHLSQLTFVERSPSSGKQYEETWVQCDKCESWQHQICGLFNDKKDEDGQAEFICAFCCIEGIRDGTRKPLPRCAILGAEELPRTRLSNHIEKRLQRVEQAAGLTVRVVLSVDRTVKVRKDFLKIFENGNYPVEFSYREKVLLLFQKIEGVDVCLLGMYVQEYGSQCSPPNQRVVYISYLDSVKYFRPDVKTVEGEGLRTVIYHEILIGYLEYCRNRGFASCYIWASPPPQGTDYILHCHPKEQKTPNFDMLNKWYRGMIRKARDENIVMNDTDVYNEFFSSSGERKAMVTAARLPYFDGDMLQDMISETLHARSKGAQRGALTSKDDLLMRELGEKIRQMKDDFIVIHMQHPCSHCRLAIVSGTCWTCDMCELLLCEKCYVADRNLTKRNRHGDGKHTFSSKTVDVPADTGDSDVIMENEIFDNHDVFLAFCRANNYQYDTLRRAKHSSMMVLYHLHNPLRSAVVLVCDICKQYFKREEGWYCGTCPQNCFDLCGACNEKGNARKHRHELCQWREKLDAARPQTEHRVQRILRLLVHASQCSLSQCRYRHCANVRELFRHGMQCRERASGGCFLCMMMWSLLQLHARHCREFPCQVPRCKDLKEHFQNMARTVKMTSRRTGKDQ